MKGLAVDDHLRHKMLLIFQQEMDCMLSEHVMALHAGKKR